MIYLGSDHGGFEVKKAIMKLLKSLGLEFEDLGPFELTQGDDYPDYAQKVVEHMKDGDYGILICDTGIGMSMVANRYKHIRAALCPSIFDAMRSREHEDANVLCLGAETTDLGTIEAIVKVFFDTPFSEAERHIRRIHKYS